MPLNYPENRESNDAKKGNGLETEIQKLEKILEAKKQEMKSRVEKEKPAEVFDVKEKFIAQGVEYEKSKEKESEGSEEKVSEAENFSVKRQTAPTAQQIKALDDQLKGANVQHQLTLLTNIALLKSVYSAIKKAREIGNSYLLDRLHDMIVNEMYEDLVKKKKIKPIK